MDQILSTGNLLSIEKSTLISYDDTQKLLSEIEANVAYKPYI